MIIGSDTSNGENLMVNCPNSKFMVTSVFGLLSSSHLDRKLSKLKS